MPGPCSACTKLSVESLLEVARVDFQPGDFSNKAYFQHHESFNDLEKAGRQGCDFCRLVLECFQRTPCFDEEPWDWPDRWIEKTESSPDDLTTITMYSVAKGLAVSDIKLCLNATHLYSIQGFEDAKVFDEVLIQVGEPSSESQDGTVMWSCPVLRLILNTPREQMMKIGGFRIGRYEVDPILGSPSNHRLAKQWLTECRLFHTDCLARKVHELPTRVIDVGASLGSTAVQLVLSQGKKADYVALSHCWGGAISPLLTTETLAAFRKHIDLSILPANFRDAVIITRNLGIRYLWIDSLCIQQNSKADWEIESQKMGLVYRNSTVTISALVSAGSKEGILKHNLSSLTSPKQATIKLLKDAGDRCHISVCRKTPNEEDLLSLDLQSALTGRGWTLQEYILSPRHILYGKDAIYWRCPQGFISSNGLPKGGKFPEYEYINISQIIYSDTLSRPLAPPSDIIGVLDEYYDLVRAYSRRRLTYGSDKLPAFSGLAQQLHPVFGGDYVAGIWTVDFRNGLLWLPDLMSCRHAKIPYRAPSWSWAVTDDLVTFHRPETAARGSPSSAELLDFGVELRNPASPYGEIISAKLVIKALTKPFVRSRQIIGSYWDGPDIGLLKFDEGLDPETKRPGEGLPRVFHMKTVTGDYLMSTEVQNGPWSDRGKKWDVDFDLFLDDDCIVALIYSDDNEEEDAVCSNSTARGLILRQKPDGMPGAYERIGIVEIELLKVSWLKTWEWQVLTLV